MFRSSVRAMVSVPAELRPMLPGLLGAVVLLLLARVVGGKKGVKASNALVLISGASQGIGEGEGCNARAFLRRTFTGISSGPSGLSMMI